MVRRAEEPIDPIVLARLDRVWSSPPTGVGAAPEQPVGGADRDDSCVEINVDHGDEIGDGSWEGASEPLADPFRPPAPRSPRSVRSTILPDGGHPPAVGARALAALNPGRRAVVALAVVGALVALIAAYFAWQAQPHTVIVGSPLTAPTLTPPASLPTQTIDGLTPGAGSGGTAPVSSSAPPALIVVAISGRVRHPGLVRLPPGSRVADAIAAAGGVLPGTDLSFVNLAAKIVDGELVVIGETPPPGATLGPAPGSGDGSGAVGGTGGGLVDINTATEADLDTLPGIGPALAQRIIDYRTQHGAFHSIDELRNVSGIGDSKFAEIKDLVTV